MKKAFYSLLFVILFSTTAFAQQKDFKTIGLGVRYYPGFFNKYIQEKEGAIPTLFTIAVDPVKDFRIESDFGVIIHQTRYQKEKFHSISFGIGFSVPIRKENHVFLPGLKADFTTGRKQSYVYYTNSNSYAKFERISLGPVMGYEFLFANTIGLGGDIGLKYAKFEEKLVDKGTLPISNTIYRSESFYTESSFFVRVYF